MQALSIIDCPVEPHLLPVLVKVKKILANVSTTLAWKPCQSVGLAWYVNVNYDDDNDYNTTKLKKGQNGLKKLKLLISYI